MKQLFRTCCGPTQKKNVLLRIVRIFWLLFCSDSLRWECQNLYYKNTIRRNIVVLTLRSILGLRCAWPGVNLQFWTVLQLPPSRAEGKNPCCSPVESFCIVSPEASPRARLAMETLGIWQAIYTVWGGGGGGGGGRWGAKKEEEACSRVCKEWRQIRCSLQPGGSPSRWFQKKLAAANFLILEISPPLWEGHWGRKPMRRPGGKDNWIITPVTPADHFELRNDWKDSPVSIRTRSPR